MKKDLETTCFQISGWKRLFQTCLLIKHSDINALQEKIWKQLVSKSLRPYEFAVFLFSSCNISIRYARRFGNKPPLALDARYLKR